MNAPARPVPLIPQDEALRQIADHAEAADAGQRDLAGDMALLARSGLLAALCAPGAASLRQVAMLRAIGRVSLPVGRLAEGHMNALRLVQLYGTPAQRRRIEQAARQGTILGIWGADDGTPVHLARRDGDRLVLRGAKRFASGLGCVGMAVVTARTDAGTQLALVEVAGPPRADASGWRVTGMRATASGRYDLEDAPAEALGAPGDYEREPYFEGGVWRYVALHVGALEALAEAVRRGAAGGGEAQMHRVARIVTLARIARLIVEDAAAAVEAPGAGPAAVLLALAAREAVEQACLEGIALADRALGTRSFALGAPVERLRRDLGLFLRQADLDGKLRRLGEALCAATGPAEAIWEAP